LDKIHRTFFWQGGTKKKYHLIKWTKICKSKKKGGLGIKSIRKMNISLLCKWLWKLETDNGIWQQIIKYKYLKNDSIYTVKHRQTYSAIWSDLLKVRDIYLQGRNMNVENGQKTLFWKDKWLYNNSLEVLFPDLFDMCLQKNISVDKVKQNHNVVTFNRWLVDKWRIDWSKILHDVSMFCFSMRDDKVSWKFGKKGVFSVKSLYNALTLNESGRYYKQVWKGKIPEKIKNFLWLALNNAILTKDNMIKRKCKGDPTCYFCPHPETVNHLLFQCSTAKVIWSTIAICFGATNVPKTLEQCWVWCESWIPTGKKFHTTGIAAICWVIWKARNKICFENKVILNPISIICHACALMSYWAGLYEGMDKEAREDGVTTMLRIATDLLNKRSRKEGCLLLKDTEEDQQNED